MIRKARITDSKRIQDLVNTWAKKGKVLERSLNYIYENLRDFWVYLEGGQLVACCSLHIVGWQDLAEIKSLVVEISFQGKGIGAKLVKKCLTEAKGLGVKNVFALTFQPNFFRKLGFKGIDRKDLPHKIWNDCVNCVHFPECCEEAVLISVKRRS